jgi:hypothetical protein
MGQRRLSRGADIQFSSKASVDITAFFKRIPAQRLAEKRRKEMRGRYGSRNSPLPSPFSLQLRPSFGARIPAMMMSSTNVIYQRSA